MTNKTLLHADICVGLNEMYKKKNADYGDSVGELYTKLGDVSLLTRITDKYNRLLNMVADPEKSVNYESMDDSIEDMANYCIIWLLERKIARDKQTELEEHIDRFIVNK